MKKSLITLSLFLTMFLSWGGMQPVALGEETPTTTASPSAAVTVEVISGVVGFEQTDASGQSSATPVALAANTITEISAPAGSTAPTVTSNLLDAQTLSSLSNQVREVIQTTAQEQAQELNNRNTAMMQIAEYVSSTDIQDKEKFQNSIQAAQESFSTFSYDVRQKMATLGIELPDATNTALLATQESMNTFLATDTSKNLLGTGSGSVTSALQEDSLKFLDQMKDNLRLANNYDNTTVSNLPLFNSIEILEAMLVNAGVPTSDTMFKLEAPSGYTLPVIDVTQIPDIKGFILPPGINDLNTKDASFFNNLPEGVVLPTDLTTLPDDTKLPANSTVLPCEVFGQGALLEIISSGGARLPAEFTETLQKLADAGTPMVIPPGVVLPPGLDIPEGSTVTFGSNTMLPPGMDLSNFKVGPGNSSGSSTGIPSYLLNGLSDAAKTQATQLYTQIETFLNGRLVKQLTATELATLQGMESGLNTILGLPAGSSPGGLGKSQITLPEGVDLPAGLTLPDGASLPTGAKLPEGISIPNGTTLPNNIVIPTGTTLPQNIVIPTGAQLPQNIEIPSGASLPDNIIIPNGAKLPEGIQLPNGVNFTGEITMPTNFTMPSTMQNNLPSWMQNQMNGGNINQYFYDPSTQQNGGIQQGSNQTGGNQGGDTQTGGDGSGGTPPVPPVPPVPMGP